MTGKGVTVMKIGLVGIGDIAKKAYLPTLSDISGLEIHLATRNEQVLSEVAAQYRIKHTYTNAEDLVLARVQAVFIHTTTVAHEQWVRSFLQHGIHVFVDKPLTDRYESSESLVQLAEDRGLLLTVGFNRRFAPAYQNLRALPQADVIVLQKNRKRHPDTVRRVVMDDFIHVVDTLRFLLPGDVEEIVVRNRTTHGLLDYVLLELKSGQTTAIGIMHRNSGYNEETLEVISEGDKWCVRNLVQTVRFHDVASTLPVNDWTPTLVHRGFPMMVADFLSAVRNRAHQVQLNPSEPVPTALFQSARDALITHKICEEIIQRINPER